MHPKYADYVLDEDVNPNDEKESNFVLIGEVTDISVQRALQDENWTRAMQEEYDALMKMETWKLVKLPRERRALTCKWVLRQKQDGRFRVRFVVKWI